MDSRSLPQNKPPFVLDILAKFRHFTQRKHADDPVIFVTNKGYYYDEEVMLSILAPSLAINMAGERWSVAVNMQLRHALWRATTAVIRSLPTRPKRFDTSWTLLGGTCDSWKTEAARSHDTVDIVRREKGNAIQERERAEEWEREVVEGRERKRQVEKGWRWLIAARRTTGRTLQMEIGGEGRKREREWLPA